MSEGTRTYLEEELRQALATDGRVSELELSVRIAGDRVIVTGMLPTEARRAAVSEVLAERCGDLQVDNQTTARRYAPPSDREERVE